MELCERKKHEVNLATQKSLTTLVVYFSVMTEEVEKTCISETSNNLFWEGSREVMLDR